VLQIVLVGAAAGDLGDLLRGAGFAVTDLAVDALPTLTTPGAAQPAAIVLDLRGQTVLPPAIGLIRKQHPQTGVVLVASTLDPAFLLDAMRAGVNELVSEPVTAEGLAKAITGVVGEQVPVESGPVYGFVGAKGGVGTTTVAVNVATVLGSLSKPGRTLLIDLHLTGGDAALFTGSEPRFSVIDALENTHRLDHIFMKNLVTQGAPYFDVLAAPERPVPGDLGRGRLQHLLAFASTIYKFTLVDLPRSDSAVLDSLDQLAGIYVVVNQELATVKSAARLTAMLRERYGRNKVTVVLSRSDRQAGIGHADVEKAVGSRVEHTFPSDYRLALQALHKGRPLALDNHNSLSASFRTLANELAGVRPEPKPKPAGLFARLTSSRS